MNFEEMVSSSFCWSEYQEYDKSFLGFKKLMRNHFSDYSGEESVDSYWNDWEKAIRSCYENGSELQRVIFLEDIKELNITEFDDTTSWTTLDLIKCNDVVSFLEDNSVEIGRTDRNAKEFLLKAFCEPQNISLKSVPIPHHHLESEVNIIDYNKLSMVNIYENKNNVFEKIGFIDISKNKVNLINELSFKSLKDKKQKTLKI